MILNTRSCFGMGFRIIGLQNAQAFLDIRVLAD